MIKGPEGVATERYWQLYIYRHQKTDPARLDAATGFGGASPGMSGVRAPRMKTVGILRTSQGYRESKAV